MESSSLPPSMYPVQAELAAMELDFDLHMAAWQVEQEIKGAVQAELQPLPPPEKPQLYRLNGILDEE